MTHVDWHPYPKEKPETHRYCFVTIETRHRKSKKKNRFVEIDFLVDFFGFYWARHKYWNIVAWAYYIPDSYSSTELPEPYRPEVKNEIHE